MKAPYWNIWRCGCEMNTYSDEKLPRNIWRVHHFVDAGFVHCWNYIVNGRNYRKLIWKINARNLVLHKQGRKDEKFVRTLRASVSLSHFCHLPIARKLVMSNYLSKNVIRHHHFYKTKQQLQVKAQKLIYGSFRLIYPQQGV